MGPLLLATLLVVGTAAAARGEFNPLGSALGERNPFCQLLVFSLLVAMHSQELMQPDKNFK